MPELTFDPLIALVAGSALGIAGVDAARRLQRIYARISRKSSD